METVTQYTHWCQNKVSKLPILSISSQLHLGLHCTLNSTFSGREFYTLGFRFLQLSKHAQGLNKSSSVLMLMPNIFLQTGRNSYAFLIFLLPILFPRQYTFWPWGVVVWLFFTWCKFTKGKEREPFATVFRVPSVRDVALNVWKRWNLFTKLHLGSCLLGERQTPSIDRLNLLAQHPPNPALGIKHMEELAGYPAIVPREDLSCAAMGQGACIHRMAGTRPAWKYRYVCTWVFSLQSPSFHTRLWAPYHLGEHVLSWI